MPISHLWFMESFSQNKRVLKFRLHLMKATSSLIFSFLIGIALGDAKPAFAEKPLSAITWMDSYTRDLPPLQPALPLPHTAEEPETTMSVQRLEITISPLDTTKIGSTGLIPQSVSGLPPTLWQNSESATLITLLDQLGVSDIPATQSVLYSLLLSESYAPKDAGDAWPFFKARVQTLLKYGAIDPAEALLARAKPLPTHLAALHFDISLLLENEAPACERILELGENSGHPGARVFCLSRRGDWLTAQIVLETSAALGEISKFDADLFHSFLQSGQEENDPLEVPSPLHPTPLQFRLYEALGAPYPVSSLPIEFSFSNLSERQGWREQILAASRLVKTGAISDNRFLGIISDRKPSASGSVWEWVACFQKIDRLINNGDSSELSGAIIDAWRPLEENNLIPVFGRIFAERLAKRSLIGEAKSLAFQATLLSPQYESARNWIATPDQLQRRLIQISLGQSNLDSNRNPLEIAISTGFGDPKLADWARPLLADQRVGEAILRALSDIEHSRSGDLTRLAPALLTLRSLGLESAAREISIYLLLAHANT